MIVIRYRFMGRRNDVSEGFPTPALGRHGLLWSAGVLFDYHGRVFQYIFSALHSPISLELPSVLRHQRRWVPSEV
jgi:hypothetical protein